ncbi:phage tail tip lysozyme [Bradyrhizobium sp. SZCCHNS2015]|uniref:phage tail tip lysozyme n=1 Tax=Bradyrhizobium sp. SZCCHNS2015 TaxID=3057305 RepID=UPI0028E19E2D|nr:phage tail tip lysozyme [Bradyrhizobium sp. SZCCHNS2015]
MNGDEIYHGLLDRGYGPTRAAALTGNILQESGGDPTRLNRKEGAQGLLQWRLDRLQGLRDYAASRGASADDPNVQLDYIGVEMGGKERRSAAGFQAAGDVASANAALKPYIRYGDDSQGRRLAYAQGFLNDGSKAAPLSMAGPVAAGASSDQPAPQAAQQAATSTAPAKAQAPPLFDMAALAAVPQLRNILPPRPNYFGLETAPFSLKG